HIVLPCNKEQFERESVASAGPSWVRRFRNVIAKAQEVMVVSDQRLRLGGIAYRYANELMHGLAVLHAEQLFTELKVLTVTDGGWHPAEIVKRLRNGGHAVSVIHAAGLPSAKTSPRPRRPPRMRGFSPEVRAMVFADAYHFSRLQEEQI